jgi:DNA-binding transcriptional regulator YdaS (Cro superfamily)
MAKPTRTQKPPVADDTPSPIQVYLEKHGISQEKFAETFDPKVTQGLVWQWIQWLKNPKKGTRITAERAIEIEKLTKGEVTRHDLRPDLYQKERAA